MNNELLRHGLATVSYRFNKATEGQDDFFGDFDLGKGTRSVCEIINHMYDVISSTRIFIEEERFIKQSPELLSLSKETERFNKELTLLDEVLDRQALPINFTKRLIQGPVSDVFTHIGQISMMSRLNGGPIEGEDFSAASITTGVF